MPTRIMMIAGEASGDMHGANLVSAIRRLDPLADVFGFGGASMRKAGMTVVVDASTLAVVGITEVVANLSAIRRGFRTAEALLRRKRPDLLILIDFPDFNLRVAATAKKLGVPVLYYISPQVWAWRRGRVKTIGRRVDHMAVILPFEVDFYRRYGLPVSFVGHPLLDDPDLPVVASKKTPRPDGMVVGLLPGSRVSEIRRHLPIMLEAALELARRPGGETVRFVVSRAPEVDPSFFSILCRRCHPGLRLETEGRGARPLFSRADVLLAASGTVTLEAAMAGVPMVVMYRVSPVSYLLGKLLIRVPSIALVNLIAGRDIVPELIQHQATPGRIAGCLMDLLNNPFRIGAMKESLLTVRRRLGEPGAADRVARIAMDMIHNRGLHP
jgi:lipid-A-disaccharide synthase